MFGPTKSGGAQVKVVTEFDHDRRNQTDGATAATPLDLGRGVAMQGYPPAAVTLLLIIETALVFAAGRILAAAYGIGTGEGLFGPHELILASAAIMFPIACFFQGSFATRPRGVAAMWGMRLIAPLAVAQLVSFAAFALVYPMLPLASSETALLHWVGAWFTANYVVAGLLDTGFEALIRRWERRGRLARHVVVYGGGPHGQRFIEALMRQPGNSLRIDAFFDDRAKSIPSQIGDVPFGGAADELIAFVQQNRVDEIFLALPWSADIRILDILRIFRALPVPVRLAPDSTLLHPALNGQDASAAALAPVIRRPPLSPWGRFVKSIADRGLAAFALLWFSPLLAAIALAIKLDSRGKVLFKQNRLGFNNRPFPVYKFRTMRAARSNDEMLKQARRRDPRVTRVGGFLRRWSLDELPQLLNVLQGNMSLVGPRPHPMWRQASDLWAQGGSEPLEAIIHEYASRHRMKPGITGWAQISGYRGETATLERMHKRVELDVYYIDHWSLWLDLKIVLRTFLALFKSSDAY